MRLLLGVMVVLPGVMAADRFAMRGGGLAKAPAVLAAAAAASDGCPWCAGVTAFGPPSLLWLPGYRCGFMECGGGCGYSPEGGGCPRY
jgi:hypothetical protein